MKIAKALKLKNRLAGEITRLKQIVQTHNSREDFREKTYDILQIVNEKLPKVMEDLVLVKTIIACSNGIEATGSITKEMLQNTPYWSIFMMAELKGLIETLRATDTKNGSFSHSVRSFIGSGSLENKPLVYIADLKQENVDEIIAASEKTIDALQDILDAHNATYDSPLLNDITV